jgi:tRNA (guanine-N7-)-methyltransferase
VLYTFTKWVIDLCQLPLLEDTDNIYTGTGPIKEELKIKTHYEGLDIAGSNRIHYLCFALPAGPLPDIDAILHQRLMEVEKGEEHAVAH